MRPLFTGGEVLRYDNRGLLRSGFALTLELLFNRSDVVFIPIHPWRKNCIDFRHFILNAHPPAVRVAIQRLHDLVVAGRFDASPLPGRVRIT